MLNGVLFGVACYATYDLTNQATLRIWSTRVTLLDLCWGAFASGLNTYQADVYLKPFGKLPGDPDAMTASIKKVKDAGKWVTVIDRALSQPGIEDLYVAGDNPGLGATTAAYFKKALPKGGNIVELRGLPIPIDKQRVDAFMDGIKGTDIKVLDSQFANWNRDDGYKVMQDFLTKYPNIDAVWTQDDDTLVGALKAAKEAVLVFLIFAYRYKIWFVGGAGMNQIVKMVEGGSTQVPVDVSYNPNMVATAIDLTALHFAAGAQVDGKMIINSTLIAKDNAKQFDYANTPF